MPMFDELPEELAEECTNNLYESIGLRIQDSCMTCKFINSIDDWKDDWEECWLLRDKNILIKVTEQTVCKYFDDGKVY